MEDSVTLREIAQELRPYPGRAWLVLRIVLAVMLATVLVMTFRIPSGWMSLYFCFVFAMSSTRQTVFACMAVAIVAIPIIPMSLLMLKFAAEPDWLRMIALIALLYGSFFLSSIMVDGTIIRNLAILFATVLTFPDVYSQPYIWEEATLWLLPMVLAGVLPIMLVTFLIRPERVLPKDRVPPPMGHGLLPDRWSNPEHRLYALKCTFAAMATYIIYTGLNFEEIQTALATCLILALPKTEQIIHKTRLRITGAVIGSAIAMTAAIWIIPQSNSLAMLLVVVAVGSAVAAWVSLSSARISYAGRQMALAQLMLFAHSFSSATDLTVLRDRVLGILLGNIMMGVTFKYLWPQKDSDSGSGGLSLAKGLPVLVIGLLAVGLLAGCRSSEQIAPETFSRPWRSSDSVQQQYRLPDEFAYKASGSLDSQREYTLSELADMALRRNPKTRMAWEQARAAAAGVGVAESAYYPQLNLLAGASYQHLTTPLPSIIFPKGYFHANMFMVRPELQVEWLLWDFGSRQASIDQARDQAMAQNYAFNAMHQQVLFSVCQAYYGLISARSALAVGEASLADAQLVEKSVKTSLEHGFATRTDLLQAQQMVAQAEFDTYAQRASVRKAEVALANSVGADPGERVRVRDLAKEPLPANLLLPARDLVERALESRPDLSARVAELRAATAAVEGIEAQAWPELVFTGSAGPGFSAFKVEGLAWDTSWETQYSAGIALKLPIFEGYRRQQMKVAAMAQKRQIEASLADARDAAVRQVWDAYTDFESARRQLVAAEALVAASEASRQSTMASFEKGFATVTDVQTQLVNLEQARESYNQARTDIFLSAALLQLATGQLTAENL